MIQYALNFKVSFRRTYHLMASWTCDDCGLSNKRSRKCCQACFGCNRNFVIDREFMVAGYVRNITIMNNVLYVPNEIIQIIHLFARLCDEWSRKYSLGEAEIIDNNIDAIVRIKTDNMMTVFGSNVISQGIYKWQIKIIKMKHNSEDESGHPPYIGIIEDDEKLLQRHNINTNWDRCGYQLSTSVALYGGNRNNHAEERDYQCKWKNDQDILEIELDLNERTISFTLNGKYFGVAFWNIKKANYRLTMTVLECQGSVFQLL